MIKKENTDPKLSALHIDSVVMPDCFNLDVKISRPGAAKLLKEEPKSALSVLKAQPKSALCRFKHHFKMISRLDSTK